MIPFARGNPIVRYEDNDDHHLISLVFFENKDCCLKIEIVAKECLIEEAFNVALNFEIRTLVSALIFLLSSLKCEKAKQRLSLALISHTYQWNVEANPLNPIANRTSIIALTNNLSYLSLSSRLRRPKTRLVSDEMGAVVIPLIVTQHYSVLLLVEL